MRTSMGSTVYTSTSTMHTLIDTRKQVLGVYVDTSVVVA